MRAHEATTGQDHTLPLDVAEGLPQVEAILFLREAMQVPGEQGDPYIALDQDLPSLSLTQSIKSTAS